MAIFRQWQWRSAILACLVVVQVASTATTNVPVATCVFNSGYWKTHDKAWPIRTLQLGDAAKSVHSYGQPELLALLGTSAKGDASITLAIQLIAAKLNVASGARSTEVDALVARADKLLGSFKRRLPYDIGPRTPAGGDMTRVADKLEDFNAGRSSCRCYVVNRAPTANAGADQTVTVNAKVRLSGEKSSDPEGHELTFSWTIVTRPSGSAAKLTKPQSIAPTFVADRAGIYSVKLVVSDGKLESQADTVLISTGRSSPTANAGADQTHRVGDVVQLDGSASSDPDGDQLAFHWAFVERPPSSQAVLSDAGAITPSFRIDVPGTYAVQLVVRDEKFASAPDEVVISTLNSPPTANAGADQSAHVGDTIVLNGAGSADVDGNALTYRWSILNRPTTSSSSLTDPSAVQPRLTVDRPGSYVVQLIVNDGAIDSDADTVTISTLNTVPTANAGADQSMFVGSSTRLDGSASSDADGNPLTYMWSLVARPDGSVATLTDPTVVNPSIIPDLPGAYVAQLIVDDGVIASSPDTVRLTTENRPPVAEPGMAQTVSVGANVRLDGSASADADNDAIAFAWAILSAPVESTAQFDDTASPRPSFVADQPGDYVIQLIVSDATSQSTPRSVIISTENSTPVANAGPDQSASLGPAIELDGSASIDPDGTALTYFWSFQSKPVGSLSDLSDINVAMPTFVPDRVGTYVAQLIVSDGVLVSQADAVIVTITDAADLAVSIVSPPAGVVAVGAAVSFHVRVQNFGPLDVQALTAQFRLPAGYAGTAIPSIGTYEPATGLWNIGALNSGSAALLTIQATVLEAGTLDLSASIDSSDRSDPNSANNVVVVAGPARQLSDNHAPAIASVPPTTGVAATPYAYDVVAVDPDAGDTLSYLLSIAPQGMSIDASGRVRWTPQGSQTGTINVAIRVSDQAGQFAVQGFTIVVSPSGANAAPVALDDHYEARTGDAISIAAPGVLANDSDPDGNRLTARILSQPANGTAIINPDGSLLYSPFGFESGELVEADHVNLATTLVGNAFGASSEWAPASRAFDVNLGSLWASGPGDVAGNGYGYGQPPFVEITFPEDVSPTELRVAPADIPAYGRILDGLFQMFDASGDELFNSGAVSLPGGMGTQTVPPLMARHRNVSRPPGAIYRDSSNYLGLSAALAFDGKMQTNWFSGGAAPQFIEVELPSAVTLHQVNIFGNRGNATSDFLTYTVQAFDAAGTVLFDSGPIVSPTSSSDQRVATNDIAGVRRVRVTGTSVENGSLAGFSEVELFDTTPSATPLNNRVRRVRLTDVRDDRSPSNQLGLAEFSVIGSTAIRREARLETNLAQLLPTRVRASSESSGLPAVNAIDDTTQRNWYSVSVAAGEFIELEFPSLVSVTQIVAANPSSTPEGFGSSLQMECSGTFNLLAEDGSVVFTSGVVPQPTGSLGMPASTMPVPNVSLVKRLRYTSAGCRAGTWPVGFAELKVIGTSDLQLPPLVAVKKYQALLNKEVHSTPIVINLTDDDHDGRINHRDIPEIVVAVEDVTNQLTGHLEVISGEDGREVMKMGLPNLVSPWADPAAADLDGDGRPEIIAVHSDRNHLIAFNADGSLKWLSDPHAVPQFALGSGVATGAIAIANLDGIGAPEIIVGASVFDATGHLLADGRTLGGTTAGAGLRSAISAVADIDLDGRPELVAGPTAYRLSGGTLTKVWQRADRADGYVAIANLDDDPFAEIVVVANGSLYVLNHDGTDNALWNAPSHAPVALPGGGQGGAPTIADVNGDGIPEIGVAAAGYYIVFNRDGTVRWQHATSDRTSSATGATVFDFDNDGQVEVIYRDEANLRIFRGSDGVVLSKIPIGSSTWSEMPVVADVDRDGHADIVVTSDLFFDTQNHGDTGVYVLTDIANRWARTRRIWNQHSYHVTNVDEDGVVPVTEPAHWLLPGLNSFRLNRLQLDLDADDSDSFEYAVSDGILESDRASVQVAIRTRNSAPVFTSTPPPTAAGGVEMLYAAQATDPDGGDILTFGLTSAPAGLAIDNASGLVRWTPTPAQRGTHEVTIKVSDVRGLFALQRFVVTVGDAVTVPNVIGQSQSAAASALAGVTLHLGDVATQHSPTASAGTVMAQSPAAGALVAAAAAVNVTVSLGPAPLGTVPNVVGMPQGAAVTDLIAAGFVSGVITGQFHPTIAAGQVLAQTPSANTQATAGSAVSLVVSSGLPPADRDQDHDGFTSSQGDCNDTNPSISPLAIDIPGDGVDQNCNGVDSIEGDTTAPTAAITSPDDLATITMPVDVRGTASDANFRRYTLQLAEVDATAFVTIGSGSAPATNAIVGRLDPTLLENGLYRVRLIVEDVNGQTTVDERVYKIEGGAKPGALRLSFLDLSLPLAGVPIAVTRTYDSREKASRDFGVGWTLDVRAGSYKHNRVPGDGWVITDRPFLGQFLPCVGGSLETRSHLTEIRLSDREVYHFALEIGGANLGIAGACEGQAQFRFVDGTLPDAQLEILDDRAVIYLRGGADQLLYENAYLDGTEQVFNPQRVRLTTIDGRVVEFDRQSGVTKVADPNGHTIVIAANGITHSSGRSIRFDRDDRQRITRIEDPAGHELRYQYAHDDLVSFTDQEQHPTTFLYDASHRLLGIVDAAGNTALTSTYDADGRLTTAVNGSGQGIELTHNVNGLDEIITDSRGHSTRLEYDAKGQVTSQESSVTIDGQPVAVRQQFGYDGDGNEILRIDPDGTRAESTFDHQRLLTNVIDPGGLAITTRQTYDSRGETLSMTDGSGRHTAFAYDLRRNLTRMTDNAGGHLDLAYTDSGLPVASVDAIGHRREVGYDATGHVSLERHRDAAGQVLSEVTFSYDANGNRVSQSERRTTVAGATWLTTRYVYDAKNWLISTIDPSGAVTATEYNLIGRVAATVDALGRRTEHTYDAVGALTRVRYPDGSEVSQQYDLVGNIAASVDRNGRTTRFEYDELNRQTRTIRPDGSSTQTVYTAGGLISASIDARGNRTDFEHDAAGREVRMILPPVVDATTGATVRPVIAREYDASGRPTATTDPNGHRTALIYDSLGRLIRRDFADGTSTSDTFDALGRRTATQDEQGRVTQFTYNAIGSMTGVVNALNQTTTYGYDESGLLASQVDALGRTTRYWRDASGRVVRRQLPGGESETFAYDAIGNLVTHVDFAGQVTSTTFDAMNREQRRRLHDGATTVFGYTADGQRATVTDAAGVTRYAYGDNNQVATLEKPDGQVIRYRYDLNGSVDGIETEGSSVSYQRDALNRLTAIDATINGNVLGRTSNGYDRAGNLVAQTRPNQTSTISVFDARNRAQVVTHLSASTPLAQFAYTLSPTGRRTRILEGDGTDTVFGYDALGRLTSEVRQGSTSLAYEYDAVGNRVRTVRDGVATTSVFDVNDRLLSSGTASFGYDANGNLTTRSSATGTTAYAWTADNKLTGVTAPGLTEQFTYDADGNRISRSVNGATTSFLIDSNNPSGLPQVLAERDAAGTAHHVFGGALLSSTRSSGTAFAHTDALGSIRALSAGDGTVTDRYRYDAFGSTIAASGATPNAYRFAGEQLDPASGLYNLRARNLDTTTGRFLGRDPVTGGFNDPRSQHPYSYAYNDPVDLTDPTGRSLLLEFAAAVGIENVLKGIDTVRGAGQLCAAKGQIELISEGWFWFAVGAVSTMAIIEGFTDASFYTHSASIRVSQKRFTPAVRPWQIEEFTAALGLNERNEISSKLDFKSRNRALSVNFNLPTSDINASTISVGGKQSIDLFRIPECGVDIAKGKLDIGASVNTRGEKRFIANFGVEVLSGFLKFDVPLIPDIPSRR